MTRHDPPRRLTTTEAGRILGISTPTVTRWARAGLLPAEQLPTRRPGRTRGYEWQFDPDALTAAAIAIGHDPDQVAARIEEVLAARPAPRQPLAAALTPAEREHLAAILGLDLDRHGLDGGSGR